MPTRPTYVKRCYPVVYKLNSVNITPANWSHLMEIGEI